MMVHLRHQPGLFIGLTKLSVSNINILNRVFLKFGIRPKRTLSGTPVKAPFRFVTRMVEPYDFNAP